MHDGGEQVVGITFPSVNIPQGDIVTSAYVLFDVDEVRPGQSDATTSVSIYGEANAASAAPTTTANDLSNRVPTSSNVMWQPEPSVGVHDDLTTPDISVVVNEIISLPGWSPGNPMTILFGHTTGSGTRWVEAFSTNNGIDTPALVWQSTSSNCGGCTTSDGIASVTGRPDSAEENVASSNMYLTSSDLEVRLSMNRLGYDHPSNGCCLTAAGFRR